MREQYSHSQYELFAELAAGSEAALGNIAKMYEELLLLSINKILHNEALAREIFNDTLQALWLNREKIIELNNPVGWMVVTARHKSINKIRDEKRKETFSLDLLAGMESGMSSDKMLENKETRRLIQLAEEKLSPQERLVYSLRMKEGLSRAEIAARLNVSENTIKNQLHNAVKNLRLNLSKMISMLLV